MSDFFHTHRHIIVGVLFVLFVVCVFFLLPKLFSDHYTYSSVEQKALSVHIESTSTPVFVATHIATPEPVKGIYMTSWIASAPSLRSGLVKIMADTEINSVVIDIKDYSGKIVFPVTD